MSCLQIVKSSPTAEGLSACTQTKPSHCCANTDVRLPVCLKACPTGLPPVFTSTNHSIPCPGDHLTPSPFLHQPAILRIRSALNETIVGQAGLLDRLLVGLLTGGHLLVEGQPGLAKTTAIKALAAQIHARFRRIQFTPDLLPSDLTGSEILDSAAQQFRYIPGPLFNDLVLADEINRAPSKVQSALLEAMQERQVTVGGVTRALPELFMVMATQNPLDASGTFALPQAQLDRFLLHVQIYHPSEEEELEILRRDRTGRLSLDQVQSQADTQTLLGARREVESVYLSSVLEAYLVAVVRATRKPAEVEIGASPRASIGLARAACAWAYLQGRDHVLPVDILEVAPDVLRHRVHLRPEARLGGMSSDSLVRQLIADLPRP